MFQEAESAYFNTKDADVWLPIAIVPILVCLAFLVATLFYFIVTLLRNNRPNLSLMFLVVTFSPLILVVVFSNGWGMAPYCERIVDLASPPKQGCCTIVHEKNLIEKNDLVSYGFALEKFFDDPQIVVSHSENMKTLNEDDQNIIKCVEQMESQNLFSRKFFNDSETFLLSLMITPATALLVIICCIALNSTSLSYKILIKSFLLIGILTLFLWYLEGKLYSNKCGSLTNLKYGWEQIDDGRFDDAFDKCLAPKDVGDSFGRLLELVRVRAMIKDKRHRDTWRMRLPYLIPLYLIWVSRLMLALTRKQ